MTTLTCAPARLDSDLTHHLAHLRAGLDARLDALLPQAGHERDLVAAAMRAGALAPGKRMRPLLLMLLCEGLHGCPRAALDAGCAVEMVHAASLVLDDLPCMDNATLRRGQPTLHLAFGEDVAILAAIALLSRAFGLLAALDTVDAQVRSNLVASMSEAIGVQGLVKGQMQDLRDGTGARSAEQIAESNQLKTGVLFGAIIEMACQIAAAAPAVCLPLRRFAVDLGQAFQLQDDLRDSDASSGKDCHQDQGKSTLYALCGESGTRERLRAHLASAEQCLDEALLGDERIAGLLQAVFGKSRSNFPAGRGSLEEQADTSRSMQ